MFRFFPLLMLVVLLYNIIAFGGAAGLIFEPNDVLETGEPTFSMYRFLEQEIFAVRLPSGEDWWLDYGDLFVIVGLCLLFVELVRSTFTDGESIVNHALSLIVLVLCSIEFVVAPGFGTSTFFFLTSMAIIDVAAGFIISIRAASRDFNVTGT